MEKYRSKLDTIDNEMLQLFKQRLDVVKAIAKYKYNNDIAIYDKEREKYIIENNTKKINKDYQNYYKQFIITQLDISKSLQKAIIDKLKGK